MNSSEQWHLLYNYTKTRYSSELQFPPFTRWATTVPYYRVNLQLFITSGNHQNSFISTSLFLSLSFFLLFTSFILSPPFFLSKNLPLLSTCLAFFKTIYFPDKYHGLSLFSLHSVDLSPFFFFFFLALNLVPMLYTFLYFPFFYFLIIPFLYNSNTGLSLELNP